RRRASARRSRFPSRSPDITCVSDEPGCGGPPPNPGSSLVADRAGRAPGAHASSSPPRRPPPARRGAPGSASGGVGLIEVWGGDSPHAGRGPPPGQAPPRGGRLGRRGDRGHGRGPTPLLPPRVDQGLVAGVGARAHEARLAVRPELLQLLGDLLHRRTGGRVL